MVCEFMKSWVLNKLRLHKKTLSPRYTLSCVFTWLVETLAKRRNNDRWAPMNYMWPGHPLLPIIGYMKALYCYLVKANIESSPMTLSSMFIYLLQQRHTVKKIFRIKQLVKKKMLNLNKKLSWLTNGTCWLLCLLFKYQRAIQCNTSIQKGIILHTV